VRHPELREDDVLVQIHAAGVNLLDSKIRNGEFKRILRYRLPLILGHDVAGVVVRVGSRVRLFKPGDEVYARPADGRIGAFAELVAIKEDDVAIKPKALTMEEAASTPWSVNHLLAPAYTPEDPLFRHAPLPSGI
jgi:NADPH:quinone reductase-like Zn-dependent oxidoreductase